jgi:hypothetical protein
MCVQISFRTNPGVRQRKMSICSVCFNYPAPVSIMRRVVGEEFFI